MPRLEYCCVCACPTGREPALGESLYCALCEAGPFCPECFQEHDCLKGQNDD